MGPRLAIALSLLLLSALPAAATAYPLTIENCGFKVTFDKAPARVVAIKSTATELLLSLGLGESIAGVAFQDGPLPDDLVEAGRGLKVLSGKMPSQEVVLATEPDLVFGGWESSFAGDAAGERTTLERLGVASYVSPAACRSIRPPKLSFDEVFREIEEIGAIFNAEAAAAALVQKQRAMLAEISRDGRGRSAVWYSSGTKAPYVGAGSGAPEMIMEALGLRNVFAEVGDGWTSVNWESVVDADPDVFVLVDSAWNSVAQKKALLAANPITRKLGAVVNQRYLVIPFPASEAGIRNVPAVVDMARQLEALPLPGK